LKPPLQGLHEVFNVHPVFVHFPIALFPSALLLYSFGIMRNWRAACVAGRACLYLATAGTVVAVITGLMAQETFPHNEWIHQMMQTHKTIGLLLGLVSLGVVGRWPPPRPGSTPAGLGVSCHTPPGGARQ